VERRPRRRRLSGDRHLPAELHDLAVETGAPTAEPEEPRGVEEFEREHGLDVEQGEDPVAPSVQATCPATFGNSDIFGIAIDDPTP
jgi:hypothetical protein